MLESYRRTSTLLRAAAGAVVATVAMGATVGTAMASTGSWAIAPAPNPDASSRLLDVACVGTSDCWAVGSDGDTGQALIEHNTGSGWIIAPTPPLYAEGSLTGVTCVSASNCWAVGTYLNSGTGGPNTTLIEHYDGSSWTQVSSSAPQDGLLNVACVTASNCWAVGSVIEQYTGGSWTVVSTLNPAALDDVTCKANICWAVGEDGTGGALIESNTGSGWVVVPNDVPDANLASVTCASTSNCWAVGQSNVSGSGPNVALTEHYNGVSWSVVASPRSSGAWLTDVACVGTSDCWAVGYRRDAGRPITYHTLIEHHLSSGWVIVPVLSDGATLSGVACVSSHDCWAVGGPLNSAHNLLVAQYTS